MGGDNRRDSFPAQLKIFTPTLQDLTETNSNTHFVVKKDLGSARTIYSMTIARVWSNERGTLRTTCFRVQWASSSFDGDASCSSCDGPWAQQPYVQHRVQRASASYVSCVPSPCSPWPTGSAVHGSLTSAEVESHPLIALENGPWQSATIGAVALVERMLDHHCWISFFLQKINDAKIYSKSNS